MQVTGQVPELADAIRQRRVSRAVLRWENRLVGEASIRPLRTERAAPGRAVTAEISFAGYCGPVNGSVARYTAAARLETSSFR
jgi:hypothetical protein